MRAQTQLWRCLLLALCFGLATTPAAAAVRMALHVIPFPGTPDASPVSDIVFSSLSPSDIRSVAVTGSESGRHPGRLVALPDGAGTAFVPSHPFIDGDRVTVTAELRSAAAATASGAPGGRQLSFSFAVKRPVTEPAVASQASASGPSGSPPGTMSFRSQDNFHPPDVTVSHIPDAGPGSIMLTPNHSAQAGPMILDSRGQLVWFDPLGGDSAFNLEVQQYQGQPVLTWWQGLVVGIGYGAHGQDVILNHSYQTVAVLHAGNGYSSDLHEFQITSQGTALIDAYVPEHANLSSVGGSTNGTVLDCVIQDLNIQTGQVLWEWHALGHVPLSASYRTPASFGSNPYDYFHLNSIQQLPDGNLLISARNTWAVYKINRSNGQVMWTLGGKQNNFHLGSGTNFEWQHDVHLQGSVMTVFDDAWDGVAHHQEESESSAKTLQVNVQTKTASLIHRYSHSPPVVTGAEGSAQVLGNGNLFVGWGTEPYFSEYTSSGGQVFAASLPVGVSSYREYRFHWAGQPAAAPSLAISPQGNGDLKVYASWNGATQVTSWSALGGSDPSSLGSFNTSHRTGFETVMTLHSNPRYVAVQALSSSGQALGTSQAHADPPHLAVFAPNEFVRATSGAGQAAVGCFARQDCHLTVQVSSGGSVLARSGSDTVSSGTGAVIPFTLSSAGRSQLAHSSSHRLTVQIAVHDSVSGHTASAPVTLIPYSIAGSGPTRSTTQSSTIQIASTTAFVSSTSGIGQILGACYATTQACQPKVSVTAGGKVIATASPEHLGAEALGEVYFQLTSAGQTMLSHAHGNQLAAQISLTDGANTATGQIALVHYR